LPNPLSYLLKNLIDEIQLALVLCERRSRIWQPRALGDAFCNAGKSGSVFCQSGSHHSDRPGRRDGGGTSMTIPNQGARRMTSHRYFIDGVALSIFLVISPALADWESRRARFSNGIPYPSHFHIDLTAPGQ